MENHEPENAIPEHDNTETGWAATTVFGLIVIAVVAGGLWLLVTLAGPPRYQGLFAVIGLMLAVLIGWLYLKHRRARVRWPNSGDGVRRTGRHRCGPPRPCAGGLDAYAAAPEPLLS